ncbi:SOS response-associated peptidase [Myceligenerans pegani]|uniref:Abasic site processing protein n=1 Tax=Myceligenerans pegani TaxID=2776917 RepID=A0ABR9N1C2_9MICO|nr:SOS response-associated peptidase [Myceligenerans sp. TRM 65318]MBE1877150.1 SOS response-associated peptidase [Myceligenerans sp. TRM 65318]MBE3019421.1 SOS response-associated peptidase [Myceligenerans sp. TRM 65318]
MCGRFASFRDAQDLADEFAVAELAEDARLLAPSWNVAPTDPVRIVVERAARATGEITRSMRVARWGLVPSWAKDPGVGARMINARSESLLDKPAFAKPLAARRCLVVADGYYEWRRLPDVGRGVKQAYWIHPAAGRTAAFAGLYEFWRDRTRADDDPARWLVTTTVITRAAAGAMERVHDRTPVVLPPDAWDRWLDPGVGAQEAGDLLRGPGTPLSTTPVGAAVGSVRNDGPGLIEPERDPRDPDPVLL